MEQRQLPNEPFALLRCRQAYMFFLFSNNWIVVLGLCSWWQCFNNCKLEDPKMSLWLEFESLGKFGNYRIPLGHSNFAGYKYLAPSAGQLRCLWVLLGPWNFGRQKRGGSRQMVTSLEPFVLKRVTIPQQTHSYLRRNWKCYNSVHTRCSYLCFLICNTALKQQKSLELPNCFFPNLNSIATRVLRWFTAPPPNSIESTWHSWTCNAWKKQADSRRFCWPNTEFCSILAVSYPWWSIIPICETASAEPNSESCSTETGKTLCKNLFFWEAEHWTKTRLINVPHQNKVWQAISYFGHTCFAANTSIDRLDVLRKGPRLTVTSGVTIIMTDYRSSWLNGQPPAKRRKTKIWLTIAHSVNNFIRSELPASKSDMAPKDIGKRSKMWQKWRTILYNSTQPLISWRKILAKL